MTTSLYTQAFQNTCMFQKSSQSLVIALQHPSLHHIVTTKHYYYYYYYYYHYYYYYYYIGRNPQRSFDTFSYRSVP